MANRVKSYFLPPEWTFKPGGRIFLGSIISNPKQPDESLNEFCKEEAKDIALSLEDEQLGYKATITLRKERGGGVDASFLSMLGGGLSFGSSVSKVNSCTVKAERLRTIEIDPSLEYINKALAGDEAMRFLNKAWFKRDIYCIVGLMIGENVMISTRDSDETGFRASVTVSAAGFGAPVEAGPNVNSSSGRATEVSSRRKSEVIMAYRLRRITYIKNDKPVVTTPYRKGALLADRKDDAEEVVEDVEYYAEALQVDDDVVGAEDFDFASVKAQPQEPRSDIVELVIPVEVES